MKALALLCLLANACAQDGRSEQASPTPSRSSPSPTLSISPGYPAPEDADAEVIETFGDHPDGAVVEGKVFTLLISAFPKKDPTCRTNFLGDKAAYLSHCEDWASGRSPYFFYVGLGNNTPTPKEVLLSRFVLIGRDGREAKPRYVGKKLEDASAAMPKKAQLDKRPDEVDGYVTFKVPKGFQPARLSYVHEDQKLSVMFPGDHRSVPPS